MPYSQYDLIYKEFERRSSANKALKKVHEQGILNFKKVGFPSRKHELYSFFDVQSLIQKGWQMESLETRLDNAQLREFVQRYGYCEFQVVLVNGVYDPGLSTVGSMNKLVQVESLEGILKNQGHFEHLMNSLASEEDIFALTNASFVEEGVYIQIKDGVSLSSPMQVLSLHTGQGESLMHVSRVFLSLGGRQFS